MASNTISQNGHQTQNNTLHSPNSRRRATSSWRPNSSTRSPKAHQIHKHKSNPPQHNKHTHHKKHFRPEDALIISGPPPPSLEQDPDPSSQQPPSSQQGSSSNRSRKRSRNSSDFDNESNNRNVNKKRKLNTEHNKNTSSSNTQSIASVDVTTNSSNTKQPSCNNINSSLAIDSRLSLERIIKQNAAQLIENVDKYREECLQKDRENKKAIELLLESNKKSEAELEAMKLNTAMDRSKISKLLNEKKVIEAKTNPVLVKAIESLGIMRKEKHDVVKKMEELLQDKKILAKRINAFEIKSKQWKKYREDIMREMIVEHVEDYSVNSCLFEKVTKEIANDAAQTEEVRKCEDAFEAFETKRNKHENKEIEKRAIEWMNEVQIGKKADVDTKKEQKKQKKKTKQMKKELKKRKKLIDAMKKSRASMFKNQNEQLKKLREDNTKKEELIQEMKNKMMADEEDQRIQNVRLGLYSPTSDCSDNEEMTEDGPTSLVKAKKTVTE